MNLFQFQLGGFTLNSGMSSAWKLECDALSDTDWRTLALLVRQLVPSYSDVRGVPNGGLKLAGILAQRIALPPAPVLIVDDVLTTGINMERERIRVRDEGDLRPVVGVVVFARGPCPPWIKALFSMPEELWLTR